MFELYVGFLMGLVSRDLIRVFFSWVFDWPGWGFAVDMLFFFSLGVEFS